MKLRAPLHFSRRMSPARCHRELRSVDLGRIRFLAATWVRALFAARVFATDAAV